MARSTADWLCYGWVGGLINTFPMLALGDEMHRLQRVSDTFDFSIPAAQGKAGYIYEVRASNGKSVPRRHTASFRNFRSARRNGDVLFWMVKQFKLLKAQHRAGAIKPEWEAGRSPAGGCIRGDLEEGRPMGQLPEREYRRGRRL